MAIKKTQRDFENEILRLVGNDYVVTGKYINARTKLSMKHDKCGYEYETTPDNFTNRKRRCPKCSLVIRGNKRRKTNDIFKKEVSELIGNEYTLLSEYKSATEKVKIKHNLCGHEYFVMPPDFISNGRRCPKCAWGIRADKRTKTTEQFKEEVFKLFGDEFSVIGEYVGIHKQIKLKHKKCNHEFSVSAANFISLKSGCPKCSASKGEKKIAKYLKDNNINFKPQFRIPECKNQRTLPFDFSIFKNNELSMLIEYDGELHFKNKFGQEILDKVKENDDIKNQYCKSNGIKLLRIPYTEFKNIENILEKELI